jgi:hypothetical protein
MHGCRLKQSLVQHTFFSFHSTSTPPPPHTHIPHTTLSHSTFLPSHFPNLSYSIQSFINIKC